MLDNMNGPSPISLPTITFIGGTFTAKSGNGVPTITMSGLLSVKAITLNQQTTTTTFSAPLLVGPIVDLTVTTCVQLSNLALDGEPVMLALVEGSLAVVSLTMHRQLQRCDARRAACS